MNKKKITRLFNVLLSGIMAGSVIMMSGCKNDDDSNNSGNTPTTTRKDSIVIMTEELSGLFNPFYATSGADMDVVGMTQIGMLSTDYEGEAGKEEAERRELYITHKVIARQSEDIEWFARLSALGKDKLR